MKKNLTLSLLSIIAAALVFVGCDRRTERNTGVPGEDLTKTPGVIDLHESAAQRESESGQGVENATDSAASKEETADSEDAQTAPSTNTQTKSKPERTYPMGLQVEVLKEGDGAEAKRGQIVTVHYTGKLTDGTKFDSSKDRNRPFTFTLGAGQVIRGWDLGVEGMKVGEVRKLIIPAELGYGARGAGGVIPPNATLEFEVELLGVN